jgi:hypothetical protein
MNQLSLKVSASYFTTKGKEQLALQLQGLRNQGVSWGDLNKVSPVSQSTTRRWCSNAMDTQSQLNRSAHQRHAPLLTEEEKNQLIEESKIQRSQFKTVDIAFASTMIEKITDGRVKNPAKSYVCKLYQQMRWHSWMAIWRNRKELRASMPDEITVFRQQVNAYISTNSIPQSRVWVMDETGLWNGSVVARTYVDPETLDPSVLELGDRRRDTGVAALSLEGDVFAWFIRHVPEKTKKVNRTKIVVEPGISGMNINLMQQWVHDFHSYILDGPAVLLLDRLGVHINHQVNQILEALSIKVFLMPPQSGKYISPCDNFIFASLKRKMSKTDCSTTDLKEAAFRSTCANLSGDLVRTCWEHCNWC